MMERDSAPWELWRWEDIDVSLIHIKDITDAEILAYQILANAIYRGDFPKQIMCLQYW